MRLPTIIKLPQHHRFNFKPRFWDQDKEELQERIERAKREAGKASAVNENGEYVPLIKGQMRGYMSSNFQSDTRHKETQKANARFVIILAILGFIAYYLFY